VVKAVQQPRPPPSPAPEEKKPLATLESPTGSVTLVRGGVGRSAEAGALFAKDVIETGAEASALIRLPGARLVELGEDGRFELDADAKGVTLVVTRGLVLTRVPAAGDGAAPRAAAGGDDVLLTISTPFGLTRVGNAALSLTVDDSSASVDVKLGEIELVSRTGDVSRVGAGSRSTLGTPRELPLTSMTLVVGGAKAEFKAKAARAWVPLNARKLPSPAAGDSLRVRAGTVGLAPQGGGSRLALVSGSEVTFGEARRSDGAEATALELKKGELEVSAPRGKSSVVAVAPGVTLESPAGGQFAVRKTAQGFEVEAHAGDVRLAREGQAPVVVPAGSVGVAGVKGEVKVREVPREVVVLPARIGSRVYHSGLKRVTLSWDGEPGEEYRVQVASDASFENVVRDGLVRDTAITVPAPVKGTWHWRVWKGDAQVALGSASFAPEPRLQDLSRVKNVVPDGPETTTIFYQDKPPVVTFTWTPEDGAVRYVVKVYREGQLGSPVAERLVTEASAALPENTLGEGRYLWSVAPLDAAGRELRGGRLNKLLMVYDNAVPSLVIRSPQNGDVAGREVAVVGVAPFGSRLIVNGRPVPLDEKARFDTKVAPLAGGRMVFRLLQGGVETYTVRTVRTR
jgi:ferric-dicitrate binding protein FerR (iron transport regulator)